MSDLTALQTIHRTTLIWLIISQLLVLLPFVQSHSLWLVLLMLLCPLWRGWALHRSLLTIPAAAKYGTLLAGLALLYVSGYQRYSFDTMVAIVLLGFVLKNLETWGRRDALVLVFTGYFLSAVHFVYSQAPWQAGFTFLTLLALTCCAISLYRSDEGRGGVMVSLRPALQMLLLSLPLALLLFVLVPRLPPLWLIPQHSQATTGLSEEIRPGDIASLVKSDKVAFRVNFLGDMPPQEQWYWRALVFQHFDGKSWTLGEPLPALTFSQPAIEQADYHYQLVMQESGQQWVPALDTPVKLLQGKGSIRQQRILQSRVPINSVMGFEVLSNTALPQQFKLRAFERRMALRLPRSGNEKLRRWARDLYLSSNSNTEFIQQVLNHIRQDNFYYTLTPPTQQSESSLDEFWFEVQQGFCSHYASAFVFIMRSVGIPARMVGGYLGGRYNAAQGYITVRQMDAHAWAEVWLPEEGWQRVDPTAAVAPERVREDLSELFADTPQLLSELAGRASSFKPLYRLQLWMDNFEYHWQRWVVQFDEDSRMGLINRLFAQRHLLEKVLWIAGAFALLTVFWLVLLGGLRRNTESRPIVKVLVRLEKKLSKRGLTRDPGEGLAAFLRRAEQQWPERQDELRRLVGLFYQLEYTPAGRASAAESLREIKCLVKAL